MQRGPHDRTRGFLLPDTLRWITAFTFSRPKTTLWAVFVLSCACVVFTIHSIQFKTKRSDLIDPNAPFNQRWIRYTESFGEASDMIVAVEAPQSDTIKAILDELGNRLRQETDLFEGVLYKIDLRPLRSKGLQYLTPEQLETGINRLSDYEPVLSGQWDLIRLDALAERLHYQISQQVVAPASGQVQDADLEYLTRHALLLSLSLKRSVANLADFQSPWPNIIPADAEATPSLDEVYFLDSQGTMGFLKAKPVTADSGFAGPSTAIERMRTIIADISSSYPDARIGLTGIPILESDEMRKSQEDMLNGSIISVIGVIFLVVVGFRGVRHPLLALIMLAVGMAWAFGYTTLVVGHLNILSVSFAVILIGLGIDFAIHYLARYLQLRHEDIDLQPSLLETSDEVGTGIVTSAITTAFAFFCTLLTDFLGVAELGIIAAGGILLCAAATFVVIPALVSLVDRSVEPRKLPTPFQGDALRWLVARRPVAVIVVSLIAFAGLAFQAFEVHDGEVRWRVRYDSNLLNMQADGLDSVETEQRICDNPNGSLLFAVSVADSPEEARALHAKFESLPTVHHVEELASRLPAHSAGDTQLLVQAIHAHLARLDACLPQYGVLDPSQVGGNLERLHSVLSEVKKPFAQNAAGALDEFLNQFETLTLQQQIEFLGQYQFRIAAAIQGQFKALAAVSNPEPVSLADLPKGLTSRYVSSDGEWLVQVFPKESVWDDEPLARFVTDIRSVDPEVTGTPLQNYEASRQIFKSYRTAACYAMGVIGLVLLVDFLGRDLALFATLPSAALVGIAATAFSLRHVEINPVVYLAAFVSLTIIAAVFLNAQSFRNTLLAMLPPVAGGLLMFGIMGIMRVDLNPANLIVLPLILGIGVDNGVHVLHDFLLRKGAYRPSSSTINAIVLTALTSMIGFGSLMVSSHRGLQSLGLVLVIGIGSCLFVSLVCLPALLTIISRSGSRRAAETPVQARPQVETSDEPQVIRRAA